MRLSTYCLLLLFRTVSFASAQNTDRGVKLFESHDWVASRTELTAVVKRNDNDARAHYYLGRLAIVDNDIDVAVEQLERAVKLGDNVAEYHLWYGRAVGQQGMRSSSFGQLTLAKRMANEMERAVTLDPNNVDARDALLDFYSVAPAMLGGSAEKASEQADAIARLNPMRGHFALGRIAIRAKDSLAVEGEMNAAIALSPDTLRLYSALASWYSGQTRWAPAFATLDRYVKRRPQDIHGANAIGRMAAISGEQLDRGEANIRAFLARPPKDASAPVISLAYLRLGQILKHKGNLPEARIAFDQAVKLDAHNADAKKEIAQ